MIAYIHYKALEFLYCYERSKNIETVIIKGATTKFFVKLHLLSLVFKLSPIGIAIFKWLQGISGFIVATQVAGRPLD